ncbi:MAG: diguanylate cyclase [Kofleriaceae bacterium]
MGGGDDLRRWQAILLLLLVGVLAVTAIVTVRLVGQLRAASQAVSYSHAERVIDADGVEIALFTRSAGTRGYLLTGDRLFLEDRINARRTLLRRLASLQARRVDGHRLDAIRQLIGRLDVASDRAISSYAQSRDTAREIWERDVRPIQAQLVREVDELVISERAAFKDAREEAADAWRRSARLLTILLGGVAIVVMLLIAGYARVTRALLARQEAEQEQTTFRILEQVPVGIFVLAANGTPYYANHHATKLLGRGIVPSSLDKLSEAYPSFEAGTDRPYPTARLPVVRALAGETSESTDIELRRDDEVIPLHVVAAPVFDVRGNLRYAVAGFQDVRELQRVAMRDSLTGLANRTAILQIYARERAVSARANRPFSIAMIDLDRFKSVNDTHGHASGDEVLKRTAATIVESLRKSDAVGRWGGEELVVLFPNTEVDGAARALDKVLSEVRALAFLGKDGAKFSVTFSAGAVVTGASESLEEAMARADVLLYEAKRAGRDRILTG